MLLRGPWIASSQELLAMTANEMVNLDLKCLLLGGDLTARSAAAIR